MEMNANTVKLIKIIGLILGIPSTLLAGYQAYKGINLYIEEQKAIKEATISMKEAMLANAFQFITPNVKGNGSSGTRWALELLAKEEKEMRSVKLNLTDLSGSNLANVKMPYLEFTDSNLSGGNLHNATLNNAHFNCSTFTDVDFSNANLKLAVFTDANVTRANFTGSGVTIEQLKSACINKNEHGQTILPKTDFKIDVDMFGECSTPENNDPSGVRPCKHENR